MEWVEIYRIGLKLLALFSMYVQTEISILFKAIFEEAFYPFTTLVYHEINGKVQAPFALEIFNCYLEPMHKLRVAHLPPAPSLEKGGWGRKGKKDKVLVKKSVLESLYHHLIQDLF